MMLLLRMKLSENLYTYFFLFSFQTLSSRVKALLLIFYFFRSLIFVCVRCVSDCTVRIRVTLYENKKASKSERKGQRSSTRSLLIYTFTGSVYLYEEWTYSHTNINEKKLLLFFQQTITNVVYVFFPFPCFGFAFSDWKLHFSAVIWFFHAPHSLTCRHWVPIQR